VDGTEDDLAPLRDFLSGRVKCPRCRAEAELRSADPVGADAFDAHLTCRACHQAVTHRVATDDLLHWLRFDN
jgi:transposase-like protein